MASANKIPLKCDICPKKPRFSDVSHLLTHISSKTHLSNIFKARVRLEIDTESRRLVEDYDQWYAEWSIQDLLAERLSQKDSKMPKPRSRARELAIQTRLILPRSELTLLHSSEGRQRRRGKDRTETLRHTSGRHPVGRRCPCARS
jgi:hypothetical protein